MKSLYIYTAIIAVLTGIFIGAILERYHNGKDLIQEEATRNYEAAALESDFLRWYFASLEPKDQITFSEQWDRFFEGIEEGRFDTKYIKSKRFQNDYYWSY
jgi:hypothetical protein